ncbi:hypothetical protein KMZ14_08425 [Acinetobacter schindleri]|uniref:hypothetical protein n=1 Tax=Acinetobacter schindleri TaxID=108981 RepID=UPI002363064D|nr:hypothetical protein [Acinetobacter schindleri]WDE14807.1 hypothetical protein KMZ14_08425 [Acinetobacter schindleri]
MNRLAFAILLGLHGVFIMNYAVAKTMTQEQFDQYIAEQTRVVNDSKAILDEPHTASDKPSISTERQALCDRIQAYQNILKASQENSQLNMASMMAMVAQNYLDRQNQSMNSSGMTTSVFCKSRAEQPVEEDKAKPLI